MTNIPVLHEIYLSSAGISTDTRQSSVNKIFFALKGERYNGNHFAEKAIENGCQYAVVDDPLLPEKNQFIRVNNSLQTLQQLALYHRKTLRIPFIGLTGSNGKTTTKELISAILGKKYKVLATEGNFNNHIGVPLTVLSKKICDIAVVEMGANHPGEIRQLCEIARPDHGLITNIGKAHLEGFGSTEGVLKTKKELYNFIDEVRGTLFVNFSNPTLKKMAQETKAHLIPYGTDEKSVCSGKLQQKDLLLSLAVKWSYKSQKGSVAINSLLTGSYNIENILAAITVGLYFNINIQDIKDAVESYIPSNNRSQLFRKGSNTIIVDTYNANPTSMLNALTDFLSYPHRNKIVILGDMFELGNYAEDEHYQIIKLLRKHSEMNVYLVGMEFRNADKSGEFRTFSDTAELIEYFKSTRLNNSLILLKGSRGMRLEKILDFL